jgi:hypothetical protein
MVPGIERRAGESWTNNGLDKESRSPTTVGLACGGGIASILLWGKLGINISRGLGVVQDNFYNRQAYCSIDAITI